MKTKLLLIIFIIISIVNGFKITRSSQRHSLDDITATFTTTRGPISSAIYKSEVSKPQKYCESGKIVNNECVTSENERIQDKIKEFSKLKDVQNIIASKIKPKAPVIVESDEESEEPISDELDTESDEKIEKPKEKLKIPIKTEKSVKDLPAEPIKKVEHLDKIKEKIIKDEKRDLPPAKKVVEKVSDKPETKAKGDALKLKPKEEKVEIIKDKKEEVKSKVPEDKLAPPKAKVQEDKLAPKAKDKEEKPSLKEPIKSKTDDKVKTSDIDGTKEKGKEKKPSPKESSKSDDKVGKPEIKKEKETKVSPKEVPSKKSESGKPKSEKKNEEKVAKKPKKSKKPEYTPITQRHFDRLYYSFPSFAPNYTRISNDDCKIQGQVFLRQLKATKLWSIKMLDSTGKIPSGILHGNINQLGDYDQCTGISTKIKLGNNMHVSIQGKYCLVHVDLESTLPDMDIPVNMAQGRTLIKSTYNDPGHFIPRFSTIRWGLCIPDSCSAHDAKQIMRDSLRPYNHSDITGLRFHVYTTDENCIIKEKPKTVFDYNTPTLVTLGLFVTVTMIVIMATLRDTLVKKENPSFFERLLYSFSLRRTSAILFEEKHAPGEITCIHGIRSVCTLMLYVAHKLIPLGSLPFSNRTDLTELTNAEWSTLFRGSLMYTDSFLLISGVLSAYNMSQDMEKNNTVKWRDRLLARYLRLTPALAAVILFSAYIFELIGDGPLWYEVVTRNANICKENFWKNLLYIQNFFPFEEICSTHTHQLALDMQLSLLSPILVWFWYKKPMLALLMVINLHILSFGVRFYFTTHHQLSLYVFHGISVTQLYRTANKSYGQTLNRATSYIAGVCLGILLKDISKRKFELPKILSIAGWVTTLYFAGWSLITPSHMAKRSYQYNVPEAAQYAALTPVALSLALSWVIFYCFVESTSVLNQILSHRYMILFSRISYPIYLVQFIVFFYNVGTARTSSAFGLLSSINITEFAIVITLATLLTLTLDLPMQDVKKVLFSSNTESTAQTHEGDNDHLDEAMEESEIIEEESDDPELYNFIQRKSK